MLFNCPHLVKAALRKDAVASERQPIVSLAPATLRTSANSSGVQSRRGHARAGRGLADAARKAGVIKIEFAGGGRMRISGSVDAATVSALMNPGEGQTAAMIPAPSGARVWAAGHTNMRKGLDGLAPLPGEADRRPVTVELARRTPYRDGGVYWPPRHALVDLGQLIGLLAARLP